MFAVEAGGVDGLLDGPAVMDHAEEEGEGPLVLLLAAGGAEGHPGLAVAQRHAGGEGGAGALAGGRGRWGAVAEPEHLAAGAHGEAEVGDDGAGLEPAAGGGGADHVAPAVDDVDVDGVGGC